MGLAASQSRLLLLTARKNDIEGQMMTISNEKLDLSRQSSTLSSDYTNALNSKKLTWSSTGSDLSYNLLMHPNTTLTTGQYLLTDTSSGAVVLDDEYQTKLGLSDSGSASDFTSKYSNATSFVAACMGISDGSVPATSGTGIENFTTNYSDSDVFATLATNDSTNYSRNSSTANVVDFYTASTSNLDSTNITAAMSALENEVTATTGDTGDVVQELLKSSYGSNWGDGISSLITQAAATAQEDTLKFYDGKMTDSSGNITVGTSSSAASATAGTNNVVDNPNGNDNLYVDRTQIVKTFLAYFDAECAKIDGNSSSSGDSYAAQVGSSSTTRASNGGTGSSCTVTSSTDTSTGDVNSNNIGDSYESSYYQNMYTALASSGWQVSAGASNQSSLQTQVLNGNISLNQYSSGGWGSVSSSSSSYPIESEDDTTAIDKAQAEYDANKDKLDYKESQLDVSMNDLDTERSAIETETTSVQKVIDKNIETSFKMFQNA